MRCFDADVLVHYFVGYEPTKHQQALQLVQEAVEQKTYSVSLLGVQETIFVMAKLKAPLAEINDALKQLLLAKPIGYEIADFNRAAQFAQHIGVQNINDCLHVALAEARGCAELITYNRKDFVRLQPFTSVKIIIL